LTTRLVRRVAADILGVGEGSVWFDPEKSGEISAAVTRNDVRRLISEGKIAARPPNTVSKGRLRAKRIQISRGRRRGHGTRKGALRARTPKKVAWIRSIRAIRAKLTEMRDQRKIERADYRTLYVMAKAGYFRSVSHLETYVTEKQMLRG